MFVPGPQIEIYPGPLLPNIQVRTISEAGIQQLLAAADQAGLLADVDYSAEINVADVPTATVTIAVDGQTWVHEAYALGFADPSGSGTEVTPERRALADFLAALQRGDLVDAANLGPEAAFAPDNYLIEAYVVEDLSAYGPDVEPTVLDWPAPGVLLADAASCVAVDAATIGETLLAANQLTFFEQDGVIYQVAAKPQLPGVSCGE